MELIHALRLKNSRSPVICFSGAGGKTTAVFQLARQFRRSKVALVTSTTHLGIWQTSLADHHIIASSKNEIKLPQEGVVLITGDIENERTNPISPDALSWLRAKSQEGDFPLLIESDGSRQKPLKAPAEHEPPIPEFADVVIYVAGLSSLGKPLNDENIHRAERFSNLTALPAGSPITKQSILNLLAHPQGGLKNIPKKARRIALLNQADTPELQSIGSSMAPKLLESFDAVLVTSLQQDYLHLAERSAGIILAAGTSSRYGQIKQLLDWKGKSFIRHVAETALRSGLEPVVVVTGFQHAEVESHLQNLPVKIIYNPEYTQGQSTSIKAGISALPQDVGSAVFLLADQPQIPVEVVRALIEAHSAERQAILAPLVLEERRANPVLFDQDTFADLMQLQGDMGGRGIFDKHRVSYLPWHDDILLFDVDKPEDYERLKNFQ